MSCHSSNRDIQNATAEGVLIENSADNPVLKIDNDNISPLHAACNSSHIDKALIRKLVEEGADVNKTDFIDKQRRIQLTPLMIACSRSDIDVEAVKLLIELGADTKATSWVMWSEFPEYVRKTALMFAVNRSKIDVEAVRVLLDAGSEVNATDDRRWTPLMLACNHSEIEDDAVKLLIEHGADVNLVNKDEENAAMRAADHIHADVPVIHYLLDKGTNADHRDDDGKSLLMYPAPARDLKLTQRLIDMGADMYITATDDDKGMGVLGSAAAFGSKEVVKFYLDKGFDVNQKRDDGQTPLILAVWGNSLDVVKLLVDYGADLSISSKSGISPLMSACSDKPAWILIDKPQKDVVEYLLKRGVNVEQEDDSGTTALHYLVQNVKDSSDVQDLLLKYGADINHKSEDGVTPIFWATNPDFTRYMIKKGADIHAKTKKNNTPLLYAVMDDKPDVAQVLLDAGSDRNARNAYGKDVRMYADTPEMIELLYKNGYKFNDIWTDIDDYYNIINSCSSNSKKAKLLLTRLKVDGGTDNHRLDNDILNYLVDSGTMPVYADEIAEELKRRNPNVFNEDGPDGWNPMELSLHKYHGDEMTEFLLRHGAEMPYEGSPFEVLFRNAGTSDGLIREVIKSGADINVNIKTYMDERMPVLNMIAYEAPNVVKDALDAGADPNISADDGLTPLMMASDVVAVKALIKAGADVNAKLKNGKTVLMIHARTGSIEMVKALLDAGAVVDGETITYAGSPEMAALLRNHTKDVHYTLNNLLYLDDITEDMVKDVIQDGFDINQPLDEYNQTLLTFACRMGQAEKINVLLKFGADPNVEAKNDSGMTPFMLAVSEWMSPNTMNLDTIRALIQAGANVNKQSSEDGRTALMYAVYNPRKGLESDIVKLLIDAGADVKALDQKGRNVLFYISYQIKPEIVKLLIDKGANPRQKNKNGETPLMRQCDPENAKILIDAGVDVKAKNTEGKTALIALTDFCSELETYQLLLKAGADINHKDKDGRNALYYAVHERRFRLIEYLLESGIQVNAKDKTGKTVIETLEPSPETPVIVEMLREHGATGKPQPGWDKEIHYRY